MPKKTKVGRPKVPKKELKKSVSLRMSPAEIRLIDKAAKRAKQRPATWRRNALLGAAKAEEENSRP